MHHRPLQTIRLLAPAALVLALAVPAAWAQQDPLVPKRVEVPPVIDGVLDDEAWKQAPSVTGFKTWLPDFGDDMGDPTVVWYAYDAENLYFAFRAHDREPAKIKASMANRDSIRPDDWICINLDSFNDQQALYGLYVNPLGIQMDSRYAANQEDLGFDLVWYSAGRIDAEGYSVEIRVPFKSLRYSTGNPVTMSVVFERFVSRRREDGTWPPLDPKAGMNFLIQGQPIVFRDVRHYKLLEVLPDATYSRRDAASAGHLMNEASQGEVGVSVKYGLTPQLTADGTYNPDFSQVEADAGQIDVNLRHPLFFPEKRPFFLEGQEVFNLGGPSQHSTLQAIVHTRNIVDPVGGAKVTGKLARADTLAALYALDDGPPAAVTRTQFSALRYKRALNQDAYLGGFYAGREQGGAFNRVAGADGLLRLDQSSSIGFYAFASDTRHEADEGAAAGHALGADFTHDTRRLTAYLNAFDISKTFEADSGYLTRNGAAALTAYVAPKLYPRSGPAQRIEISGSTQQLRDEYSGIWEGFNEAGVHLFLKRAASASLSYHYSSEVYNGEEFDTSGVNATGSIQLAKQLRVQGAWANGDAIYYATDPFGGRSTTASLAAVFQPSEQWNETFTLSYANFSRPGDAGRLYDYTIARSRTTYQLNRYLFFRGILEYNSFRRQLVTDLLASFTYIPGTVLHAGYGSLYERTRWDGLEYVRDSSLRELRRGLFFKASYLWRL